MAELKEGQKAPVFTLKNQDDQEVSLADFKGKKVVLYFYPKDLTPGCTTQACDFNSQLAQFKKKKTVVLGVSFDSAKQHQKFREKHALGFDLLVDEHKEVAQKYGVYQKKKFMGKEFMGIVRSTFLINEQGIIEKIYSGVKVNGHVNEVLEEL